MTIRSFSNGHIYADIILHMVFSRGLLAFMVIAMLLRGDFHGNFCED